jgi:hypothetical protein
MREDTKKVIYPAGTIISCLATDCGNGLYKVVEPASFTDLVIFDEIRLVRLNKDIPKRCLWEVLACPLCGTRLLKGGQIHTLQYGWK